MNNLETDFMFCCWRSICGVFCHQKCKLCQRQSMCVWGGNNSLLLIRTGHHPLSTPTDVLAHWIWGVFLGGFFFGTTYLVWLNRRFLLQILVLDQNAFPGLLFHVFGPVREIEPLISGCYPALVWNKMPSPFSPPTGMKTYKEEGRRKHFWDAIKINARTHWNQGLHIVSHLIALACIELLFKFAIENKGLHVANNKHRPNIVSELQQNMV